MAHENEIKTDRLTLQRLTASHAPAIAKITGDPRIYRMVARIPANQTMAQTLAWVILQVAGAKAGTDHVFAVMNDDQLIGLVGGHRSTVSQPFEIGYWVSPDWWNKGFATEATGAVINWLESRGQFGVVAGHFVDNPASGRVLSKLGFMKAGRDFQFCIGRGELVAHLHMARISETA